MQLQDVMAHLRESPDPMNQKAHEFLDAIFSSPYFDSYITLKGTMTRWNEILRNKKVDLLDPEDKGFEKTHKYLTEMTFYIKSLEELKAKMLPSELAEAEKKGPQSTEQLLDSAIGKRK
jgi:hypothetical protein